MSKKNSMGSDVVDGFACKPKVLDANKPVMYSAIQLFVCDGHRCKETHQDDIAKKIRAIIQELGLNKGTNRIKVTKTACNGACRFRNFAYIYRNAFSDNFTQENSFAAWKQVHKWSDEQWREMIIALSEGKIPEFAEQFKVEDKVYEDSQDL